MLTPRDRPCGSCPYRTDCPSGVWDSSEYEKLIEYDGETHEQPLGVFLCHSGDRHNEMCRGWIDSIHKHHSIALRMATMMGEVDVSVFDLPPSGIPVFSSGQEAHDHGVRDIEEPGPDALKKIESLGRRISRDKAK